MRSATDTASRRRASGPPSDAAARFAAEIDRRVNAMRAGRLLSVLGTFVCLLITCVGTVATLNVVGLAAPSWLAWLGAAVGAAVLVGRCRRWPGRLEAARVIERSMPALGERISRAVDLPAGTGGIHATEVAGHLQDRLAARAAEEAVEALARSRSVRSSSVRKGIRWASLAGILMALLIVTSTLLPEWRAAIFTVVVGRAELVADDPAGTSRGSVQEDGPTAAPLPAAISRGLVVHRWLADELSVRFVEGPGLMRDQLPNDAQDWLDQAAELQRRVADDLLDAIDASIGSVEPSTPLEAEAMRGFHDAQQLVLADVAPAIRANRLATAGSLIRTFLEAAAGAGLTTSSTLTSQAHSLDQLSIGTRAPEDDSELAAARLARLVHPTIRHDDGRPSGRSPSAASERDFYAASASATGPGHVDDDDAIAARSVPPTVGGPSAGGESVVSNAPSAVPAGRDAGAGTAAGKASAEAWVHARDRRPSNGVAGLAGTGPADRERSVDRYFSILAGAEPP